MVTPSCFGLVKLLDVDYSNGEILLILQDNVTKSVSKISIDVDDKNIKLQFINWNDIKKLINDDINCLENENGSLLESES